MKIILANGIEKTAIIVTGGQKYTQGASRDALTFVFADVSMDEIDRDFTETNCESIALVGDDGSENIHKGYVIRTELVKKPEIVKQATVDTDEVTEMRVMVTMAQRTYAETKLAEIEAQNMDTALAVAELGVMIAGGIE